MELSHFLDVLLGGIVGVVNRRDVALPAETVQLLNLMADLVGLFGRSLNRAVHLFVDKLQVCLALVGASAAVRLPKSNDHPQQRIQLMEGGCRTLRVLL